jgi:hypothetical protein
MIQSLGLDCGCVWGETGGGVLRERERDCDLKAIGAMDPITDVTFC